MIDLICDQMIITQINRDASVDALVIKINEFYHFITEDNRPSKLTSMQDILKSMADQILDCARFIKNYSERKNFCMSACQTPLLPTHGFPFVTGKRLCKNIGQETDATITKYKELLDGLMQSFRDRAVRDTHITVQETHAIVNQTHIAVDQIIEELRQLGKLGLAF